MTKIEIVLAVVVSMALAVTIYFGRGVARSVAGETLIPTSANFMISLPKDSADATLTLKASKNIPSGSVLTLDLRNDSLYEQPAQTVARGEAGLTASVSRNRALFDFNPAREFPFGDFGTFAGVRTGSALPSSDGVDSSRFIVGLRASPVRGLFGVGSADILADPHDIGLGVGLYLPSDIAGDIWAHWGLGYGRLWSIGKNSGSSTGLAYLSFSTYSF